MLHGCNENDWPCLDVSNLGNLRSNLFLEFYRAK